MTNTKGLLTHFSAGRALPLNVTTSGAATIATGAKIRILIADHQTISRCGLRKLLETQSDFDIVGEVTAGAEAVRLTDELRPDILLLVLSTHELSSLDVVGELTEHGSTVRSILLYSVDRHIGYGEGASCRRARRHPQRFAHGPAVQEHPLCVSR